MLPTRREFLLSSAAGAAALALPSRLVAADERDNRKTLALVTTIYQRNSHSDHIAGRFLTHYTLNGKPVRSSHRLASMYVQQVGMTDLSRTLAERHHVRHCGSIREALTLGGDSLAVDGILVIGEHGEYPINEYGQKLYPRHEFFSEIVELFRQSGRSAPIFNDKHFSWSWTKAKEIFDWSKELKFPLQAGSSLPVTWRRPELELPLGAPIEEALVVAFSDPEIYGFHALETLQCHVERRKGGETGLKSVQALAGDAVWSAAERGLWSKELYEACLSRSETVKPGDARHNVAAPLAYRLEYRDGFRATVLMLDNHVGDFTFAARLAGSKEPVSCVHVLPNPPGARYFDALVHNIEGMLKSGKAVIPPERTLLVSGALEALLHSRHEGSKVLQTPQLAVAYQAPEDSGFYRGPVAAK